MIVALCISCVTTQTSYALCVRVTHRFRAMWRLKFKPDPSPRQVRKIQAKTCEGRSGSSRAARVGANLLCRVPRRCGCQARAGKRIQCPAAPAKRGRRRRHHRPDPRSGRTAACRSKFLPKPGPERCRGAAARHAQGMALSIRQAMDLGAVAASTAIELGIRLLGGAPDRAVQLHSAAVFARQRASLSTYRPDAEPLDIGHREAVCAEICRWIDALESNRWFAGCPINLNPTLERRWDAKRRVTTAAISRGTCIAIRYVA